MKTGSPDRDTQAQLAALGYISETNRHDRPLLICDVDEVVLHLIDPFEQVLDERGYLLKSHSFKLTGNIFDRETGREASQEEVWAALIQLFEEQAERQHIVSGVSEALNSLYEHADIVFLTNMPHQFGDIRRDYLSTHDLPFPLITNSASKVPAMRTIAGQCDKAVGFIDDTPKNLQQVQDSLPDIHLFHFVANDRFRLLAGDVEGVRVSSGNWAETSPAIRNILVPEHAATEHPAHEI